MSYLAQYNRVLRWREQLNNIELNHDIFEDYVIAYFQSCYHLKEWIKNDSPIPEITKKDLEKYISKTNPLRICTDIANGTKHFILNNKRIENITLQHQIYIIPNFKWVNPPLQSIQFFFLHLMVIVTTRILKICPWMCGCG